jgi:hypothetical protein
MGTEQNRTEEFVHHPWLALQTTNGLLLIRYAPNFIFFGGGGMGNAIMRATLNRGGGGGGKEAHPFRREEKRRERRSESRLTQASKLKEGRQEGSQIKHKKSHECRSCLALPA